MLKIEKSENLVEKFEGNPNYDADIKHCKRGLKKFLEQYIEKFDYEITKCRGYYTNPEYYRMDLKIFEQKCQLTIYKEHGIGPFVVGYNGCFKFEDDQKN